MKNSKHSKNKIFILFIIILCFVSIFQIQTVNAQSDDPSFSITSFTISPTTIDPGESIKVSLSMKASNIKRTTIVAYSISDVDLGAIISLPIMFTPNKLTININFNLPLTSYPDHYTTKTPGTRTFKASIKSLPPTKYYQTVQKTLTIKNPGPNEPIVQTIPKNIKVGETFVITTKVSHDAGLKCQIRYDIGSDITEWTKLFDVPKTHTTSSLKYTKAGTYTIKAQVKDEQGKSSLEVTLGKIVVEAIPPPTISFSASSSEIYKGNTVTLSWTTTNADSITILDSSTGFSVDITGKKVSADSVTITPSSSTTYIATAIGSNTAIAYEPVTVLDHVPTVKLTADKTSVVVNDPVTISWTSQYATRVEISPDIVTSANADGSYLIYPRRTTTYVATVTGVGGSNSDTLTIYVVGNDGLLITEEGFDVFQLALIAFVVLFVLSNLIYFQKNKKWVPYGSFFGKIWAWIKNKEYEEKKSNSIKDDDSYYDYVVEYDDMDNEATNLYRRKKESKEKNKGR